MRIEEGKISKGTLELSQKIQSYLKLKEGETVLLEPNKNGTVTLRKKENIAALKGIIRKGKTPELHANGKYQFKNSSKRKEES